MGQQVNAVVITVPTNFTEEQKQALEESAKAAGVEVLQFISEPVAVALAYDARPETEQQDKVLVVADLGGIRSDIAVIASRGGMYSVLATAHDYEFAGQNLDQVLIDYFAKEFIKKNKTDPREDPRGLAKLKMECEATKKALSLGTNATISIESLADGIDFGSTINRTRYELLANKVFGGIARLIEGTIKKAELDVLDIDQVRHKKRELDQVIANVLGYSLWRNFAHTEDCVKPRPDISSIYEDYCSLYLPNSHQSFRAIRPRCCYPGIFGTGIRPR